LHADDGSPAILRLDERLLCAFVVCELSPGVVVVAQETSRTSLRGHPGRRRRHGSGDSAPPRGRAAGAASRRAHVAVTHVYPATRARL